MPPSGWERVKSIFFFVSTRKETVMETNVSPLGLHQRLFSLLVVNFEVVIEHHSLRWMEVDSS